MNKLYTTLLALTTLAMMVPASAQDACVMTTSEPEVSTDDGGASGEPIRYVDADVCQPTCIYSIWIYEEYNGIEGLQRADSRKNDFQGCEATSDGGFIVGGRTVYPDLIIW